MGLIEHHAFLGIVSRLDSFVDQILFVRIILGIDDVGFTSNGFRQFRMGISPAMRQLSCCGIIILLPLFTDYDFHVNRTVFKT